MELNGLPETFEGYKGLTNEEQAYAHFTILKGASRCLSEHDKRLGKLEKRNWFHTAAAGIGGVIGGFIAFATSKFWG